MSINNTPKAKRSTISWQATPPCKHLPAGELEYPPLHRESNLDPSPMPMRTKRLKTKEVVPYHFDPPLRSIQLQPELLQSNIVPLKVHFTRFLVVETSFNNAEKRLCVWDADSAFESIIILRDLWSECNAQRGQYINVSDPKIDPMRPIELIIDDENGSVVLEPDLLITCTALANSFDCTRRAWLSLRFKQCDNTSSIPIVHGKVIHSLFQAAIIDNNFETHWLQSQLRDLVRLCVEDLYAVGLTENQLFHDLLDMVDNIQKWERENVQPVNPKLRRVFKVLEVEERIWSQRYGIKGNIDATLQMYTPSANGSFELLLAPMELKTGKSQVLAHRTQLSLYNLMLNDKYGIEIGDGVLSYLGKNISQAVKMPEQEKKSLIQGRNNLVHYLFNDLAPPLIQNENACNRCFNAESCLIFHKMCEGGNRITSGVPSKFDSVTDHITNRHILFFQKWDLLISNEEQKSKGASGIINVWTRSPKERQNEGTSINDLVILDTIVNSKDRTQSVAKLEFTLGKTDNEYAALLETKLLEGDPIIVMSESCSTPVAVGYLLGIHATSIHISVDRPLVDKRQDRIPMFDVPSHQQKLVFSQSQDECPKFSIAKDQFVGGQGLVRNNLIALFRPFESKLRRMVVELEAPTFTPQSIILPPMTHLNNVQIEAIKHVTSSSDYTLLLGMPGTGKTTVIAELIKTLVFLGKSILLTSYTHSAVDNVLLKLMAMDINFIRLGSVSKMHYDIRAKMVNDREAIKDAEKLTMYYESARVVSTTALGISHPIFGKRKFDYCIVDESSQMALPVCLGPLRYANSFVLVGDHYQLPPLFGQVNRKKDAEPSLFKYLCQAHPESVVTLKYQYRMNADIMSLSNHLVYDNRLACGHSDIAAAQLHIPHPVAWFDPLHSSMIHSCTYQSDCWLGYVLDPQNSVVFINTDTIEATETRKGPFIENPKEARLVLETVIALVTAGVSEREIGVVSPYRNQLRLLEKQLKQYPNVEILTIDKCQGRDKSVILISLTRSNPGKVVTAF